MSAVPRLPVGPLLLLSLAIFASVTAELLPAGLLVPIAGDLRTTEVAAGSLVAGFAAAVAVLTLPLTALTRRIPRKPLLVAALVLLGMTTVASGLSNDIVVMTITRVIGGAVNGVFWAVTGPYAARLVAPSQVTRAMALTTAGGTLAFVAGVPLGTAVGAALGWRTSFLGLGVVLVVSAIGIALLLPPTAAPVRGSGPPPARGLRGLVLVEAAVLLFVAAHHLSYTYVSVWLADRDTTLVAGVLLAFGIAGGVSAAAIGVLSDRSTFAAIVACGSVTTGVLAVLAVVPHPGLALPGAVVWGLAFGPIPVLLQALLFRVVDDSRRDLAAAVHTVVFNLAIAAGATSGGVALASAVPTVLPAISAVVGVGALGAIVAAWRENAIIERRHPPRS